VQNYFEILVDTLLGYWLQPWKLRPGNKQVAHPKFYLFDSGVARALSGLPRTAEALRTGEQSWSAIRELTRVVTAETEAEWLAYSRGRTVRQLERKVSLHQRGESPRAARTQVHAPRRMVFEVAPEDLGTVRAAIDVLWGTVLMSVVTAVAYSTASVSTRPSMPPPPLQMR
jgi:hypothetical protein